MDNQREQLNYQKVSGNEVIIDNEKFYISKKEKGNSIDHLDMTGITEPDLINFIRTNWSSKKEDQNVENLAMGLKVKNMVIIKNSNDEIVAACTYAVDPSYQSELDLFVVRDDYKKRGLASIMTREAMNHIIGESEKESKRAKVYINTLSHEGFNLAEKTREQFANIADFWIEATSENLKYDDLPNELSFYPDSKNYDKKSLDDLLDQNNLLEQKLIIEKQIEEEKVYLLKNWDENNIIKGILIQEEHETDTYFFKEAHTICVDKNLDISQIHKLMISIWSNDAIDKDIDTKIGIITDNQELIEFLINKGYEVLTFEEYKSLIPDGTRKKGINNQKDKGYKYLLLDTYNNRSNKFRSTDYRSVTY